MSVNRDQLVDAFSDSVGTGQAETIVERAASRTGVDNKMTLSEEEALALADTVTEFDDVGNFVRISANTLKTRIRSSDL